MRPEKLKVLQICFGILIVLFILYLSRSPTNVPNDCYYYVDTSRGLTLGDC